MMDELEALAPGLRKLQERDDGSSTTGKFYPCRKGCGSEVTFDNRFKNPDVTRFVPLVQDSIGQLSPHDCQKKNQQQ